MVRYAAHVERVSHVSSEKSDGVWGYEFISRFAEVDSATNRS